MDRSVTDPRTVWTLGSQLYEIYFPLAEVVDMEKLISLLVDKRVEGGVSSLVAAERVVETCDPSRQVGHRHTDMDGSERIGTECRELCGRDGVSFADDRIGIDEERVGAFRALATAAGGQQETHSDDRAKARNIRSNHDNRDITRYNKI